MTSSTKKLKHPKRKLKRQQERLEHEKLLREFVPEIVFKERICLKCSNSFLSEGNYNRICGICIEQRNWNEKLQMVDTFATLQRGKINGRNYCNLHPKSHKE